MPRKLKTTLFISVLILLGLFVWRMLSPSSSPLMSTTKISSRASTHVKGQPYFRPRSAKYAPLPKTDDVREIEQEAVELAYPEGVILRCSAPGLEDGQYRVIGSKLSHLRIENEALSAVLTKPSEGEGFLATLRGHPLAEIQWSEASCRVGRLSTLTLDGVVVDPSGNPVANMELVGCVGDIMTTQGDGTFRMDILQGQTCWPFAFRDDDDGFAKGAMVEVIGGQTDSLELKAPGPSMSAEQQKKRLQMGAHQLIEMLERQYDSQSPVSAALDENSDNPLLRTWADEEVEEMNLRYQDIEDLLSGDATEEDWRDAWLFGIGM